MNNNLYPNTGFINQNPIITNSNYQNDYVDEYLKRNIGKIIEAHVSFCDSIEWRDSIFTGRLESVGKDYLAINNNQNTFIIWNIYLDYIVIKNRENT